MQTSLSFEQGPIRPPSEAGSLLIRVTRNCPWNKCVFCSTYKGRKFSRRSVEEIKGDVDAAKAVTDRLAEFSRDMGEGGHLTQRVLTRVLRDSGLPDSFRTVGLWLASGGSTVFLQDANSLMISTDSLIDIIGHIRDRFPRVTRITSYARASSLKEKTVEQLCRLREAGLNRLHVGMESGSDRVLAMIQKGNRAEHLIEGGRRVVASGISLCLYVIPGIGGTELSDEHAQGTARVINRVNPGYLRFRSLYVRRGSPLADMVEAGTFTPPDEDAMVREIRAVIEQLDGISTTLVSDHILNLLEDVEGTLPQDKHLMLDVIDTYLALPDHERELFRLGRRGGAIRGLDDFRNPRVRERLEEAKREIERDLPGGVAEYIEAIKMRFV